jgi:hypothetical protein
MPYAELVEALKLAPVACFHSESRQRDDSYRRAIFCVNAGGDLFDAFFNSARGHRGMYFDGPAAGDAANRQLIDALMPSLIEWVATREPSAERAWLVESMSSRTAKAWLAEDAVALCPSCAGGWGSAYVAEVDIENGRWEHSPHMHAVWGRQAPQLSKLRIFGGFVNAAHDEWIAEHKRDRTQHIWAYGWT